MDGDPVREKGRGGGLPQGRPRQMWGGPGGGASCSLCGELISAHVAELELEFDGETQDGGPALFHVHALCFSIWETERQRTAATNRLNGKAIHADPRAGKLLTRCNLGTMPNSELDTDPQQGAESPHSADAG